MYILQQMTGPVLNFGKPMERQQQKFWIFQMMKIFECREDILINDL
jgi:hypothetical protein